MAKFAYVAIDSSGKEIKGTIESDEYALAKNELKNQGYLVVSLKEQNVMNQDINIKIGGKVGPRDLSVMCRQLVSMIRAGVSVLDAIKLLGEQTENARLQEAVKEIRIDVEKGEGLAESMKKHPKVFPELMINMVAAGEASGSLDIALERVAVQYERSGKTQALVKKAMIYPIIVLMAGVVITVVMLLVVIPKYETMFSELGTELPGITKFYVGMSKGLVNYWYIFVPVIIGIAFLLMSFSKTNTGKHVFGWIALHFPLTKKMTIKSASSMMARTLSTLLGSGVPMIEAVNIVSTIMTNVYFREAMEQARDEITIGMPLSSPLEKCGLFPPMVYHMVRIGEEAGSTEEMLDKLADYYDEEVEMAVQSLMAAMEPMIILMLAGLVGGLVAACMMPMMDMYKALDNL